MDHPLSGTGLLDGAGAYACPRPHFGCNLGGWDPSPCTVGANIPVGVPTHIVIHRGPVGLRRQEVAQRRLRRSA